MVTKRVVVAAVSDPDPTGEGLSETLVFCNDGTVFAARYGGAGLEWEQTASIPLSVVDEPDVPDGYVVIDLEEVEPGDLIRFKDGGDALWEVGIGADPRPPPGVLFVTHHEGRVPRNFSKTGTVTTQKVTFAYRQEGA